MGSIKIWEGETLHHLLAGIGLCSVEGKRLPVQEMILLFARQFDIFLVRSRIVDFRIGPFIYLHNYLLQIYLSLYRHISLSETLPLRSPEKEGRRRQ